MEEGYEKVAVYSDKSGSPKHVSRQKADGIWTSKLGRLEDIEHHGPEDLEGGLYGSVAVFMRRRPLLVQANRT